MINFRFNFEKAKNIKNSFRYKFAKWIVNVYLLNDILKYIKSRTIEGCSTCNVSDLKDDWHSLWWFEYVFGIEYVKSDTQWIVNQINKRGFETYQIGDGLYGIKLPR